MNSSMDINKFNSTKSSEYTCVNKVAITMRQDKVTFNLSDMLSNDNKWVKSPITLRITQGKNVLKM